MTRNVRQDTVSKPRFENGDFRTKTRSATHYSARFGKNALSEISNTTFCCVTPGLVLTHQLLQLFMLRAITHLNDPSIDSDFAGKANRIATQVKTACPSISRRGTRYFYRPFCHHYWVRATNQTPPHSCGQLACGCHTE